MRLALVGDIALFGRCAISNDKDYKQYYKSVAEVLSEADYVVGNLETPFSLKKRTHGAKSAYLFSEAENVQILRFLHVNALSLANNHMFDYGSEGYETTKQILERNGIEWFGTEGKELDIDLKDNHLSFLGFCCYSTNPLDCVPYGEYGVNEFNVKQAITMIDRKVSNGYLPIVSVHAGTEHVNYPNRATINVARAFSKRWPMVYYGHHPHVVQGIEEYGHSLIAYSLGNFCFDDVYTSSSKKPLISLSDNNRSSCILLIDIQDNQIMSWSIVPIYIGQDSIEINKGASIEHIHEYSNPLQTMKSDEYNAMRRNLITDYIESRKRVRNIFWYMKRMKPRYFRMIINAKNNSKKYKECVTDRIMELTEKSI